MTFELPEIKLMEKRLSSIEKMVQTLIVARGCKAVVTVKDIAQMEGVSLSQLRLGGPERYLLPRFGESAFPTGTTRWPIEEYIEWRMRDPEERETEYRKALLKEARMKRAENERKVNEKVIQSLRKAN